LSRTIRIVGKAKTTASNAIETAKNEYDCCVSMKASVLVIGSGVVVGSCISYPSSFYTWKTPIIEALARLH
jgi:hypothetical protein